MKLTRLTAVLCIAAMVSVSMTPVSGAAETEGPAAATEAEVTQTAAELAASSPAEAEDPAVSEPEETTTVPTAAAEEDTATVPDRNDPVVHAMAMPSLTDKSLYYLGDNVASHLCLVSSNMFMLRRMAIIVGSSKWKTITLSAINAQGIRYSEYRYTNDGYTYHVNKYKKFTNTSVAGVKAQLIELLKSRPEGVVIYGDKAQDSDLAAGKAADHGILITEYKNGTFYGIDPSHNRNGKSKGIEKLSDTTLVTLKGVTHYMCILDIAYNASSSQPTTTKPKTTTKPAATAATKATTKKAAASTLKIKSYSYPKRINQGQMFDVKGQILSNYKIAKVTVSIINKKGKAVISKSASPKAKKYNLVKIDNAIKFGKLKAGKYTYKIVAKDGKVSKTLVKKKFTVDPPSKLKITDATYPKTLLAGQMFTIKGKVSSNYKLKKVTVGIYTTKGKAVSTASKSLKKKKSYNVIGLDEKIKFGSLSKGTYYYKVTAKDSKKSKTLLNKKFTVK